ncbi:myrosinase 1-like [Thrips palmi]|uniref:beta-glucosidase n=1 Tax=Thrips palmi TaxID=161013 RepID=A0A6P8ZVH3_THRPL|nr:myrosinase 1-like [Thrips palmi]
MTPSLAALAALAVVLAVTALPPSRAAHIAAPESNSVTAFLETDDDYPLPEDLIVGTGSSSYQVEGAWNVDGKGESVFDYFYHNRNKGSQNADDGCDSYHKYKEDVKAVKALKMQMYRFSLSWSRIMPDGTLASLNQAGVDYYNNLINELIANGIEPFITLYHFDHPQVLETQFGGWTSPKMIDLFVEFSRFAFKTFGDRVKYWVTLNEPHMHCNIVYDSATIAPAIKSPGIKQYQCIHNELVAHAKVYRLYKSDFNRADGLIGMTVETFFASPTDTQYENIQAAERYNLFEMGIQADPIIFGDYPALVKDMVAAASKAQGYKESRLPPLTADEQALLKGSTDFIGLNAYYGRSVISGVDPMAAETSPWRDAHVVVTGPGFASGFSMSMPWAFRGALLWLKERYGNQPIFVTENGVATTPEVGDHDIARAAYHSDYIRTLVDAVRNDGCKVIGMTAWSLLDGFEWGSNRMMGMVSVDLSKPEKPRKLKDSSAFYVKMMTERKVPLVKIPDSTTAAPVTKPTTQPAPRTSTAKPAPGTSPKPAPGTSPKPAPATTPKNSASGLLAPWSIVILAIATLARA